MNSGGLTRHAGGNNLFDEEYFSNFDVGLDLDEEGYRVLASKIKSLSTNKNGSRICWRASKREYILFGCPVHWIDDVIHPRTTCVVFQIFFLDMITQVSDHHD